jgi:arylsulfatase
LAKNTIVIYTTDHGNNLGHHGQYGKMTFYDDDARLPFIMRFPGQPKAGTVIDGMVEEIDLMPTLLQLCGVPIPRGVQGKSMVGLIQGTEPGKNEVFGFARGMRQMIRTKDWKLILDWHPEESLLFDLKADPLELNNLYGKPEVAKTEAMLKERLLRWHLMLPDKTIPNSFTDREEAAEWIHRYMDPVVDAAAAAPTDEVSPKPKSKPGKHDKGSSSSQ